jgi:hypothetical protein
MTAIAASLSHGQGNPTGGVCLLLYGEHHAIANGVVSERRATAQQPRLRLLS